MKNLSVIGWIAVILLIIGGLNIGFMGVFDYNYSVAFLAK
ncbi:DUF378 domain-containing protein [Coxiella burnetii]